MFLLAQSLRATRFNYRLELSAVRFLRAANIPRTGILTSHFHTRTSLFNRISPNMEFSTLPSGASGTINPYTINTSQETLDEMKTLIKVAKIAPKTYESTHADTKNNKYGIEYDWLIKARDEWLKLDWRKTEEHLNTFPHFTAKVEYVGKEWDVHFTALFSKKRDAVPLICLHGWPGNFLEFIPILTILKEKYTPDTLPYNIIVPSLPGYAYSSGPLLDRDPTPEDLPSIMNNLMKQLGFGSGYVAQGGDIGSGVSRGLGFMFDNCKAVHINMINLKEKPEGVPETKSLPEHEQKGVAKGQEFHKTGWAYGIEHGTRPATIGFVLQSSPIALLSWVGEKFISWTDTTPSLQHILESVTLYWITDTISRCIYPYRLTPKYGPVRKPFGFSSFHRELNPCPESWAKTMGDLVFYRYHQKGGHFAALEQPEILLKDIDDFVELVWKKDGIAKI